MVKVCSVCSLKVRFNIDYISYEIRRLYWVKFIVRIKACVHYFYFYHQNKTSKKLLTQFFFTKKSSFYPQDFQICVLPSHSLFSILGPCWFYRRSWLMISSKVYGLIMSLNWILKAHRFFNIWWSKVLFLTLGHEQIWLSQLQLWSTTLAGRQIHLLDVLNTSLYLIWSEGHWELWYEVGFQILANHIFRVWT